MPEQPFTAADLQVQRKALLAELAEPGHFTKAEAQAISTLRAPVTEHLWGHAWLPEQPWSPSVAD